MQRLKYDQTYIVFDTETEGLNLHSSRTWQLAWIKCKGKKIIERNNRFVDHPNLYVSPLIRRLTGFTDEEYNKRKEPMAGIMDDFEKDLLDPNNKIIGQNLLGFDVYMIAEMQRQLGRKLDYSYMPRILDTRPFGKAAREGLEKPTSDPLSWQYKVMHDRTLKAKVSQNQLLKHFGIDFEEEKLHDAMYDIEKCFEVFLLIQKQLNL